MTYSRVAVFGGMSHFLLAVWIEVEALLLRESAVEPIVPADWTVFAGHQLEAFAIGLALMLLGLLLGRKRRGRYLFLAVLLAANAALVADRIAYRVFREHLNLSMGELAWRDVGLLSSSIGAELGGLFLLHAGVVAAVLVALARMLGRSRKAEGTGVAAALPGVPLRAVAALLCVVCTTLASRPGVSSSGHYAWSLARSARRVSAPEAERPVGDLFRPRHGHEPNDAWPRIAEFGERAAARRHPPNILLVVLESVGSLQILPFGQLSSIHTPFLASLSEHMLVFDSVYTTFPGSVRSHATLHTGGRTITSGSVYRELDDLYRGPMLARALKARGYRTGLFSAGDLSPENMAGFYRNAGFDRTLEPQRMSPGFVDAHRVHSWGVYEDALRPLVVDWIAAESGRPFFLQWMSVSSHHPYGAGPFPEDSPPADAFEDRASRYYRSLRYVDWALSRLVGDLRELGILDDTLIVVTGDHGQAFGERHRGNFVHRNFLFEENIKVFLLVIDFRQHEGPIYSSRVASMGDILPSLHHLAGGSGLAVPGQNLFDPRYQPRIVYFHKNAPPATWGLRDGRWKFIEELRREASAELFDLAADPTEAVNLAETHGMQVAEYRQLCRQWYEDANREFVERTRKPPAWTTATHTELGELRR